MDGNLNYYTTNGMKLCSPSSQAWATTWTERECDGSWGSAKEVQYTQNELPENMLVIEQKPMSSYKMVPHTVVTKGDKGHKRGQNACLAVFVGTCCVTLAHHCMTGFCNPFPVSVFCVWHCCPETSHCPLYKRMFQWISGIRNNFFLCLSLLGLGDWVWSMFRVQLLSHYSLYSLAWLTDSGVFIKTHLQLTKSLGEETKCLHLEN